jgi:hypothetical protein
MFASSTTTTTIYTCTAVPDVAVHLDRDAARVGRVVPRVHAHDLGEAVDVERVVAREAAGAPQGGERVVAACGAARLRLGIDLREEGLFGLVFFFLDREGLS